MLSKRYKNFLISNNLIKIYTEGTKLGMCSDLWRLCLTSPKVFTIPRFSLDPEPSGYSLVRMPLCNTAFNNMLRCVLQVFYPKRTMIINHVLSLSFLLCLELCKWSLYFIGQVRNGYKIFKESFIS